MSTSINTNTIIEYSSLLDRIPTDFSMGFLREEIKYYSALNSKPLLTLGESFLLTCLGKRLQDNRADKLYEEIKSHLTDSQKLMIHTLEVRTSRERMDEALSPISKGEMPSKLYFTLIDDLGLDCLHYAIILEQKELATRLLSMKNWGEGQPDSSVGLCNSFYNYFFLAAIHFNDTMFLKEIYMRTSKDASALVTVMNRINSLLEIAVSRMTLLNNRLAYLTDRKEQALHNGNTIAFLDYENQINELLAEKSDITLEIKYLKNWQLKNDADIDDVFNKALTKARGMADILRSTPHPLVQFYLKNLGSADSFLTYHALPADTYCLLGYRRFCFLGNEIPDKAISCHEYSDIVRGEKKDRASLFSSAVPEYKNPWMAFSHAEEKHEEKHTSEPPKEDTNEIRWFSAEALTDMAQLKREFHILIKRYHPDETGYDASANTLREIIEEKDMILRYRKRAHTTSLS